MRIAATIFFLLLWCASNAQKDPAATPVLSKFSDAALSAPSVSMKFALRVHDKIEDTEYESDGQVVIKGNMYWLELPDNIMWFDGSSLWTLSPEVKEVTVSLPEPGDNMFITSPSSLFNMYKEGFKYRLLEESPTGSIIDLYPEEPLASEFSIIRLTIDKQYRLVSAEYRRKDGIDILVDITDYQLLQSYANDFFTFDPSIYPGIDIIDMR